MRRPLLFVTSVAAIGVAAMLGRRAGGSFATSGDLGLLTLEEARLDLARGIKEEGGYNSGPAIDAYAAPWGIATPVSWCALAFSAWVERASQKLGIVAPVGSPLAQEIKNQFIRKLAWITVEEIQDSDLRPGNVAIWSAEPNPDYRGHIGIISAHSPGSKTFDAIEGNSGPIGDRVALMTRNLVGYEGHVLLGIGRLTMGPQIMTEGQQLYLQQRYSPANVPILEDEGFPFLYAA